MVQEQDHLDRSEYSRAFSIIFPSPVEVRSLDDFMKQLLPHLKRHYEGHRVRISRRPDRQYPQGVFTITKGWRIGAYAVLRSRGDQIAVEVVPSDPLDFWLAIVSLLIAVPVGIGAALLVSAAFPIRYAWLPIPLGLGVGVVVLFLAFLLLRLPFGKGDPASDALADSFAILLDEALGRLAHRAASGG